MERLGTEHIADTGRLCCRDTDRVSHLLSVEAEQFANCNRRPEDTERTSTMPTSLVIFGVSRIANARYHLEAENEGMQEIWTGNPAAAGVGEKGRSHR